MNYKIGLSGVGLSWSFSFDGECGKNKRVHYSFGPSAYKQDFFFGDSTFHLLVLIYEDALEQKHLTLSTV